MNEEILFSDCLIPEEALKIMRTICTTIPRNVTVTCGA